MDYFLQKKTSKNLKIMYIHWNLIKNYYNSYILIGIMKVK